MIRYGLPILTAVVIALAIVGRVLTDDGGRWWDVAADDQFARSPGFAPSHVRFERLGASFEATIFAIDPSRFAASVLDLASGKALADADPTATLTVNGGYFDAKFQPLGLYRIDGVERSPLLAKPPLSGVVAIDSHGRVDLLHRDDAAVASARSAFQAGPFVIDPGGKLGINSNDGKAAERTVLAITDGDGLLVIVTTPVTLRDLAVCLSEWPNFFRMGRVERALNLDGGPSTGFALNAGAASRSLRPRGPVRSAIVFRPSLN